MHHDYLLVATHLGAPLGPIQRALSANSEISLNTAPISYNSVTDLKALRALCQQDKTARIFADFVLFNASVRTLALGEVCHFIYLLGEPRHTITSLIRDHGYAPAKAFNYYAFRLQRLALLTKHTPRSIVLTPEIPSEARSTLVAEMLKLSNRPYFSVEGNDLLVKPAEGAVADKACVAYNRYLRQIHANLERHNHVSTSNTN